MDKMARQAIRTTFDGRSQVCGVTKFCQQLHARDVRGSVAFCFCPQVDKIANTSSFASIFKVQIAFTTFSRSDKEAELLKIYFKLLVKKLKIST